MFSFKLSSRVLLCLLAAFLLLCGCRKANSPEYPPPPPDLTEFDGWDNGSPLDFDPVYSGEGVYFSTDALLRQAGAALGTPYRRGGKSLEGFDCSGFVQWSYNNIGIALPRSAREQSVFGEPVSRDDMIAGDIVIFRHPRRGYHTGIYLGEGKFIHSPRPNKNVSVSSIYDPYFNSTFTGARRVAPSREKDASVARNLRAEYGKHNSARTVKKKKQSNSKAAPAKKSSTSQKSQSAKKTAKDGKAQNVQKAMPAKKTDPSKANRTAKKAVEPGKAQPAPQAKAQPAPKKQSVAKTNGTQTKSPAKPAAKKEKDEKKN